MTPAIELERVSRTYRVGPEQIHALRDVSLRVWPGEFVAITGPSGSGKSTLLNVLGLLDRPEEGVYRLDGRDVRDLSDDERTWQRNRKLGFVFQAPPMLPRLTAEDNAAVPLRYRGQRASVAREAARAALAKVGLARFARHLPAQLSGGQLQRVAIARALVGQPMLVLADEPTAALDVGTADEIIALLRALNRETGAAVVMITHELDDAAAASRHLVLADGRLAEAAAPATPATIR